MHKFGIGQYKELCLRPTPSFSEDDLNLAVIESTLKLVNQWSKNNKPAEIGDEVIVTLNPICDGMFVPELAKSNFKYSVGDPAMLDHFKEVINKKAGDHFEMRISFPENVPIERISGKDVIFNVTVEEVITHSQQLDISDEIARQIDPHVSGIEQLKNNLRKIISENWLQVINENKIQAILDEIIANSEYELDEEDLHKAHNDVINKTRQTMISSENSQMMAAVFSEDDEFFYEDCKILAEKTILQNLIINEIALIENITISDEELRQEKERLSKLNVDKSAFDGLFPTDESIYSHLLREKTLKLLLKWNAL